MRRWERTAVLLVLAGIITAWSSVAYAGQLPDDVHPASRNRLPPIDRTELDAERRTLEDEPDRLGKRGDQQRIESELRYLNERLQRAIVVHPPETPVSVVGIGAEVELLDEHDEAHRFVIVGEDEVDIEAGRVSWRSPLGRAVLHCGVGDSAVWKRPAGDLEVEIVAVRYSIPDRT